MAKTAHLEQEDLAALVASGGGRLRRWLFWLLLLVALGALAWFKFLAKENPQLEQGFITEEARLGDLVVRVSATGTLEPTRTVDVGSELSGTLESVLVDENDVVAKDQLLAQLDLSRLEDAVTKSRAALALAHASEAVAEATLEEKSLTLNRLKRIRETSMALVSEEALQVADAEAKRAKANVSGAKAQVLQAEANLKIDQTNLGKATIRAPISGVVLSRKVEPGQTVVSAMTIPVLFSLAEDLTKMELQVQVDEADVAQVQTGQEVTFTVAAWPGRNFPASIERISLGSTITDNVVTYKAILRVENPDLALRPGMTATASIVTNRREHVLLIPNDALRFTPPARNPQQAKRSLLDRLLPKPPPAMVVKRTWDPSRPQVWLLTDQGPEMLAVKTGVSDGRSTEILGDSLKPGMRVITDFQAPKR
jgi:HlyD family secretion protein